MGNLLLAGVVCATLLVIASGFWVAVALIKAIARGRPRDTDTQANPEDRA